jgi:hypothetical protein
MGQTYDVKGVTSAGQCERTRSDFSGLFLLSVTSSRSNLSRTPRTEVPGWSQSLRPSSSKHHIRRPHNRGRFIFATPQCGDISDLNSGSPSTYLSVRLNSILVSHRNLIHPEASFR